MEKLPVALAVALTGLCAGAQNLVEGGDFSQAAADLKPLCRAEAGKVSLFTEHMTWNKCGKCEVSEGSPDQEHPGCLVHAANVLVGAQDGQAGFPVEPDVNYDFAIDVKGTVPGVRIDAVCWTGPDYWRDRKVVKIPLKDGKVFGEWTIKKGSFRTPADAKRAAIRLSVWSSSKWAEHHQHKVGDYFLFDNVRVERSRKNLGLGGGSGAAPSVAVRKTIAPNDSFSDFVSYKDGKSPAAAKTLVRVRREGDALYVDVTAEEPGELVVGNTERVWSGDAIELLFGGKDDGRVKTHLAFNAAGGKYTGGADAISNDGWELRTKVGDGRWQASAKVPFAFLGWKDPKGEIPFNVGRARPKARTFDVWSARGGDFHDVNGYGRIVVDGYAAAFKAEFGIDESFADRAAFEARFAAETAARLAAKFAKFKAAKFSVAPVPAVSDWTQPYLPEEIFDPPAKIGLKAAVNEIRALPLAIANLTDRTEDYRVVLETEENEHIGEWGLAGFPKEKIVARKGLRFKDVANPDPSTRFDPLPRLDDVGSVTVPPREAGLVWYDFDCTGVKPGVYKGRLRVIPLCEEGAFKNQKYTGKMQTVPVTLEVVNAAIRKRPAAPAGYFMGVESQAAFDLAFQIGAEHFQVHSWSFNFEKDENGDLDLAKPKAGAQGVAKVVADHVGWARRHGFVPKFSIVYSAMDACAGLYGKTPERFRRYWPQYVRGVKRVMNGAGVPDSDYFVEVKDEPRENVLDDLLEAHRIAKETEPTVRLAMLLGSWSLPQEKLEAIVPYSDIWILWRGKLNGKDFRDFAKRLQASGREVWHYSCDVTMRLPLQGYYRHHAWFGELHGLTGNYMYQLTDHIGGGKFGCKDFKSIPYGGLFYRSFGTPVPSLRLMALREGFTDVKFLAALKEKNRTANDPEIAAFLETAAQNTVVHRPNDTALPDRLRDRARELLAK